MSFLIRTSIIFTLGVALMDALWIWYSDFTFKFNGIGDVLFGVTTLFTVSWLINTYSTIPWIKKFTALFIWGGIIVSFMMVGAPSSYLFASVGGSLKDAYFDAADKALGFDWVAILTFLSSHPWIGEYSSAIYLSSAKTLAIVWVILAFGNRFERGELLLASVIISGVMISALSAVFAATGPFGYYNVPSELYRELSPAVSGAGYTWYTHLMELRAGTFHDLGQGVYQGIVQFPSFHTALSVLMILALRGCGLLSWIVGFYNLLILLTVPIDGGHYFVDMIAGGLIAVVVWYGLAALNQMATEGSRFGRFAIPQWGMGGLKGRIGAVFAPITSGLISTKSR